MILQVLVALELVGVGGRTVEARFTPDSILELPAADVHDVLGLTPETPWLALPTLAAAYPAVTFTWLPRELRLLVQDPRGVLPATIAARARTLRAAQGTPGLAYAFGGPFGSITADDSGRSRLELGLNLRGRVSLSGDYLPAAHRGVWTAAVAPWSGLSLSASGAARVESAAGRVAAGPAWMFATWEAGAVALDGLVALGPVAVFASTRDVYLVTLTRSPLTVQLGRSGGITTTRVSFGPQPASPFFLPAIPPH